MRFLHVFKNKVIVLSRVYSHSRIYQFWDKKIVLQSEDHSLVQMSVLVGELEMDAVRHHKDKNNLVSVLGEENRIGIVDSTELIVKPGDHFLLYSDGFWETVDEIQMISRCYSEAPDEWLEAMRRVIISTDDPKQDNSTLIAIISE